MGFFDDIGKHVKNAAHTIHKGIDDFTGTTAKKEGAEAQKQAAEQATQAAQAQQQTTQGYQTQLGDIAKQQMDINAAQQSGQQMAGQLGQQAAQGAGVSAARSARAAGLNKGQAALAGAQTAGNIYGSTYGSNVQQGVQNYQQGLGNAAGTIGSAGSLGLGQGQLGVSAAGVKAGAGAAQQAAGASQQNALIGGLGQATGAAILASDERVKDVGPSVDIKEIMKKVRPISYTYNKKVTGVPDTTQERIGVTAQDLEKTAMSPAVKEAADGTKVIDTAELSPMTLNLVIQLAREVDQLRRKGNA